MPRKIEAQYDYNIYRCDLSKIDELINYMLGRKFEEIPLKETTLPDAKICSCKLFFCNKENAKGSPWINLLNEVSKKDLENTLYIYGAVLIYFFADVSYVISYGNAHFYMSGYCDYRFGIQVAERLINLDCVKAQQNAAHGSKTSKTYIDYLQRSALNYGSGEIPTFICGYSINEDQWGTVINCGTSAQFKWKEKPLAISSRLKQLTDALKTDVAHPLPQLIRLDDEHDAEKISQLNDILAKSIANYNVLEKDSFVNIPSFFIVGTKFFQMDTIGVKLYCNNKARCYEQDLNITLLLDFLSEVGADIEVDFENIKVALLKADNSYTPRRPILEYLEFVYENFCLRDGKWCRFNIAYLQQIWNSLYTQKINNHRDDEFAFSKAHLVEFAKESNLHKTHGTQPYETYYNNYMAQKLGGVCNHPQLTPVDANEGARYSAELCDFYVSDALFFVKIGGANEFAYAIDQVQIVLDQMQKGNGKVTLKTGVIIEPHTLSLILIWDKRETDVKEWKDVRSINFLLHLSALKRQASQSRASLEVHFVYQSRNQS